MKFLIFNFQFSKREKRSVHASPSTLHPSSGFTLIELVVVVAIFALVTTTVLIGHNRFGGTLLITNTAYDVALTIRQAQSYGISVRGLEAGGGTFDIGYGVHFRKTNDKTIVLFGDLFNDRIYDETGDTGSVCVPDTECVKLFTLSRGDRIERFCAVRTTGEEECSADTLTFLDISFMRPDPDARFATNLGTNYQSGTVHLISPQGRKKVIEVNSTGQISIRNAE